MPSRGRRISASQVGQYAYCALAWWLGEIEGRPPADLGILEAGVGAHERHGWRVGWARGLWNLALALLAVAALAVLAWVALSVAR